MNAGTASFIDQRQRVEGNVERRLAMRPEVVRTGVGMPPEGDELLPLAEDLEPRTLATAHDLREGRLGSIEQQPLRPAADPHQRVAEALDRQTFDEMREVRVEDVDIETDEAAAPEADAVPGVPLRPAGNGGTVNRHMGPPLDRRALLAGDDRQWLVAVVEKLLGGGSVGGGIAHAKAATSGGFLVVCAVRRGLILGRHRRLALAFAAALARAAEGAWQRCGTPVRSVGSAVPRAADTF